MPKLPINLGRKMSGSPVPSEPAISKDEEHFPSLYLEWEDKYDLPDSGEMTVKFRKCCESNSKDRDGKKRQNVTLDIVSIEKVSGKKADVKDEDSGEHLDKLKEEVEKENSEKEGED